MSAAELRRRAIRTARERADVLAALREVAGHEGTTAAAVAAWIGLPAKRAGVLLSDAARDGLCRKVRRGELWLYLPALSAPVATGRDTLAAGAVRTGHTRPLGPSPTTADESRAYSATARTPVDPCAYCDMLARSGRTAEEGPHLFGGEWHGVARAAFVA